MIRNKKNTGFTLVELLVSVALMLILIGAVIMVFKDSSEVFSVSDAKIFVYQNARASLELMAKELTSCDNSVASLIIKNPTSSSTSDIEILKFRTTTSWVDGSNPKNGTADIVYILQASNDDTLWNLVRKITPSGSVSPLDTSIIGQYIPVNAESLRICYFKYNSTSKNWDIAHPSTSGETFNAAAGLPDAIRITVNFVDRQKRITRNLSRTVWLPKSVNS